jgi:integrase
MHAIDAEARFAIVNEARAWLARYRDNPARMEPGERPSEATCKRYRQIVRRVEALAAAARMSQGDYLMTYTRLSRWRYEVAALRWNAAETLESLFAAERAPVCSATLTNATADVMDMLAGLRPPPKAMRTKPRRAAALQRKLAANWREAAIALIEPAHRAPFLVLAVSGCRPAELAQGVKCTIASVRRSASDEITVTLVIEIKGVKCRAGCGQTLRSLTLDTALDDSLCGQLAADVVRARGGHAGASMTVAMSYARLLKRMHALRKNPRSKLSAGATPYYFRYAFRGDCDRRGLSRAAIAQAMGHQQERSSLAYGKPRHIAPSLSGLTVTASTVPRGARSDGTPHFWRQRRLELEQEHRRERERQYELDV